MVLNVDRALNEIIRAVGWNIDTAAYSRPNRRRAKTAASYNTTTSHIPFNGGYHGLQNNVYIETGDRNGFEKGLCNTLTGGLTRRGPTDVETPDVIMCDGSEDDCMDDAMDVDGVLLWKADTDEEMADAPHWGTDPGEKMDIDSRDHHPLFFASPETSKVLGAFDHRCPARLDSPVREPPSSSSEEAESSGPEPESDLSPSTLPLDPGTETLAADNEATPYLNKWALAFTEKPVDSYFIEKLGLLCEVDDDEGRFYCVLRLEEALSTAAYCADLLELPELGLAYRIKLEELLLLRGQGPSELRVSKAFQELIERRKRLTTARRENGRDGVQEAKLLQEHQRAPGSTLYGSRGQAHNKGKTYSHQCGRMEKPQTHRDLFENNRGRAERSTRGRGGREGGRWGGSWRSSPASRSNPPLNPWGGHPRLRRGNRGS